MAKPRKKQDESDDLGIPAFLRRKPGEKRTEHHDAAPAAVAPPPSPTEVALAAVNPPAFRQFVQECIRGGTFNPNWLMVTDYRSQREVDDTLRAFGRKMAEAEQRRLNRSERLAAMRARIERPPSPLKGLIPLRDVLASLGDRAPKRHHAKAAIMASNVEHTNFHFQPGEVTLAKIRAILTAYKPTVRPRVAEVPSFPPGAIIRWTGGKNPKKKGGAHERWEKLIGHDGKTVAVYAEAKGNMTTLRNAIAGGYAALDETPSTQSEDRLHRETKKVQVTELKGKVLDDKTEKVLRTKRAVSTKMARRKKKR